MLFNSFEFLIFFPVVTVLYFLLPHQWRWLHLLIASCVFYMFFVPVYILILFFTIIIDYFAGIWISNAEGSRRKAFLIISLVANIGVLAIFKYYNFFVDNIEILLTQAGLNYHPLPYLSILLPIGLSFHTFQAMSYTIEVYRGNQPPERHFGIYALYVMFYPQLVAGPIERPQNVLHQFHEKHYFDYKNVTDGLKLMVWGLFKKVVVADRVAALANVAFDNAADQGGLMLWAGIVAFSIQIYCDFSGYSDIALGSAQVMGFDLMTNFRRPYFARTIAEFWSRWHISLSTWFRDYLYIPLGGNRVSPGRASFNRFFVFMVSGLWHGANWTFVVWGALHGFYLIFAQYTANIRQKVNQALGLTRIPQVLHLIQVGVTVLLASFAWIFFRAKNMHDAWHIISHLHTDLAFARLRADLLAAGFSNIALFWMVFFTLVMLGVELLQENRPDGLRNWLRTKPTVVRWSIYPVAVLLIIFWGVYGKHNFIYFQF